MRYSYSADLCRPIDTPSLIGALRWTAAPAYAASLAFSDALLRQLTEFALDHMRSVLRWILVVTETSQIRVAED